jgi:parathyroid hormone receptor 1
MISQLAILFPSGLIRVLILLCPILFIQWECKLVTSLWQYFIMANYSWILMEGLYLHNLIFLALFTDSSAITIYIILGWGTCFIITWMRI